MVAPYGVLVCHNGYVAPVVCSVQLAIAIISGFLVLVTMTFMYIHNLLYLVCSYCDLEKSLS